MLTRVAFVDPSVWTEDTAPGELMNKADEVVFLDSNNDGIQQMADYLDGRSGVEAIDIISHGDTGQISPVGNAIINVDNIAAYSNQLATIGGALHSDGDILLWGCGVAGTDGTDFVQAIADGTGADVAASYDTTGSPSLGGDWDLEFATGPIEAENLLEDINPSITLSHNQPPIVSTFGAAGTVTDGQGTMTIGYFVTDPNGNLADVNASVRRDGFPILSRINDPSHSFSISNSYGLGTFQLNVSAQDSGGLRRTGVRSFTRVDDDTSGPSIGFTNAVNQNDGQNNVVSWNISDPSGIASRSVRLYSGSGTGGPTIFSNSSSNSSSFNLNSLSPGTYTVSATATDADTDRGVADRSSFQNSRTFTISDDDTSGPIISLVSPSTQPQGANASANFVLSENFASRLSSYTARLFVGSSSTQALPPISVTLATTNGSGPTSFSDGFDMSGLGPGTYRLEVTASNNDRDYGTADIESRSSTPQFITIFNPNDPPVANDDIAGEAAISEDAGDTDITNAILANDSDPDGDAFSIMEITDGVSTVTTSAPGSITLANGAIVSLDGSGSVSLDPNGQFESLGSSEFDTTSSFDYMIADTSGETDTASANVEINGVNDQPVFTASGPFSLDENRDVGFVVGTVAASDVDAIDTDLTFDIVGGNTGGAFAIDATTGQISVANKAALDFETNPNFNLTIEVDDNNAEGNSTNTSIVAIELNDLHATLAIADASGDEANGPIVFDVTLTGDVINSPFDVTYSTIDGTAQNAGSGVGSNDYAGTASSTISFDGDATSETRQISVAVNDDSVVEPDEKFSVNLLATSSNDVSFANTLGTAVIDQENPGPYNGGLAARSIYTWRQEVLSGVAGQLDGIDLYLTSPGELNVAINLGAGVQSDPPEFSNTVSSPTSGRVFIDTSSAGIMIGVGDTFVIEVTGSEDGVGLEGSYFSPGPGRYPGRLFLDSFEHPSFDLRFRSHVSPIVSAQSATGTIQNDDTATISIDDASVTEGGNLVFNVSLTNPVDTDTEVTYSTADGSASSADSDYASQTAQTLKIPAGQTSGTVTVATSVDNKVELDETMTVNLTAVAAGGRNVSIDDGTAEGTIINDDDAVVSVSAEAKTEGTAGAPTSYAFEIELSNPVDVPIDMTAETHDGSATAANDYNAIAGQAVSFAAGSTATQTVTVDVTADDIVELDEAFDLVLSNLAASGRAVTFAGSAATESATAEVINDDSATLSLDDVSQSETDGATTFTFTLSSTSEVDTDVSIGFETADGSAQSATAGVGSDDYETGAGTAIIAAGDTSTLIDVTVNGDDVVENTENFFLELLAGTLNTGGREVSIADGTGEGTITNDDTASLIIDDLSIVESDAPGSTEFVFTVSIDPAGTGTASEEDITVVASTSGLTATGGGVDFSDVINHTLTIPAGTTTTRITIDVVRENLAETDETFQVKLTDAEFAGGTDVSRVEIGDATGIGTIENDDFAPIAHVGQPYVINEGDGLTLDASGSTDDDDAVAGLTFRWDVDGDGDFDENVTGVNPTLTPAQMSVLGLDDGPHINDVTVEASDGTNIDTATTTLTIENVNPTGNADAGDVNEDGPAITIDVLTNDTDPAGANDPLSVTAVNTSGTLGTANFTQTSVNYDPNGQFESLDEGATTTDSFEYTISDGDGGSATGSVTVTIHGQNDAPVAYSDSSSTNENDAVTIDVLANDSDVDTGDNRSNFSLDDATIVSTTGLSGAPTDAGSASIVNNQLLFDPGSDYDELAVGETATVTIDYTMSDDSGSSSASTAVVTIHGTNDAPVITSLNSSHPTPDANSTDGQVTIDGSFMDLDLTDVHSVTVDWGDGSPVEPVSVDQDADTFAGMHPYATGGIFTITVTVDDGNGDVDIQTTSAATQGVGMVDGVLYIIGTDGRDHVNLRFNERNDELKVDVKLDQGSGSNINDTFDIHAVEQVVAYLFGGDDHYNGDGKGGNGESDAAAEIPQFVFGGDGNDHLFGGNGSDVLSGGAGADDLFGRSGSDILVGGLGRDNVKGGAGDDLLIGGATESENNLALIEAALADWSNQDIVAALDALGTVTDDGDKDDLKGEAGVDHLVGGTGDKPQQ